MQQDSPHPAPPIPLDAIDPDAVKVLRRLTRHGYQGYLVGGCVRDLLLGRRPKDFDIATSARPRQIKRLFRNSRIIGRRFRLAHIHFGHHVLEVATFRAPPELEEGDDPYIRQDNIFGTAEQDARRRDFTINGLFYDVENARVIDHVEGVDDLERRTIRMIGEPGLRLREDPIRILRAAKFAGRLGFTIDDDLCEAARDHREDLSKAAPPRVLEEIYRLLSGEGASRSFDWLFELRALDVLFPEIEFERESYLETLDRLAARTGGDRMAVPQSTLLSVLVWPMVRPVLAATKPCDYERLVLDTIRPVTDRLTTTRRDVIRARQCLGAQVRLASEPTGRIARRFCRREFFEEALLLRRLVGPLRDGEQSDPLPHWEELTHHVEPQPEGSPPKRKRRRRRRGGKRQRERALKKAEVQSKEEPCPNPSESSSAPPPRTEPKTSPRHSSSDDSPPAST
jgi:poly(A) polymerase